MFPSRRYNPPCLSQSRRFRKAMQYFSPRDLTKARSEFFSSSKTTTRNGRDILEQNLVVCSHPVEWLQHSPEIGGALCPTQS